MMDAAKNDYTKEKYPEQYSFCEKYNKLTGVSEWKAGIVIKAWEEELEKDQGGLGMIILVLYLPLHPDNFKNCNEYLWVVHPHSHSEYAKACGLKLWERDPLILDQAICIPGHPS